MTYTRELERTISGFNSFGRVIKTEDPGAVFERNLSLLRSTTFGLEVITKFVAADLNDSGVSDSLSRVYELTILDYFLAGDISFSRTSSLLVRSS